MSIRRSRAAWLVRLGLAAIFGAGQWCCAEELITQDVRIKTSVKPALVFEQTNMAGLLAQIWQVHCDSFTRRFVIRDSTSGKDVFVIEPNAPTVSLAVSNSGKVGIGTSGPSAHLHVLAKQAEGEATLRLEVNDPAIHAWEMIGDVLGFSLHDIDSQTVPFAIEPGTPGNTLYLANVANGHIGIGTSQPNLIHTTSLDGDVRHINLRSATGTGRIVVQGGTAAESYLVHTGGQSGRKVVRTRVAAGKYLLSTLTDDLASTIEHAVCVDLTTTNVGIKTSSPAKPFQVGDAGANDGNGAHVTTGGVWTNASSRSVKDDIQPITCEQARETVRALQPVGYRYKNEPDEKYVGFIAEDVPDLVATNDRKSLASMDITAVLTRVVQDQDRLLDEQREKISRQEVLLERLSRRLSDLEQRTPSRAALQPHEK